jgi:hypothetical protein
VEANGSGLVPAVVGVEHQKELCLFAVDGVFLSGLDTPSETSRNQGFCSVYETGHTGNGKSKRGC